MNRLICLGTLLASLIAAPGASGGWVASDCGGVSIGLVPLTDLSLGTYKGAAGGLYPDGGTVRPDDHDGAGVLLAESMVPLNKKGKPPRKPAKGRIVLLSIGMSNTTQEFSRFKQLADADSEKNQRLVIVDGAQGGMPASVITNPSDPKYDEFWRVVERRLTEAGVTPRQVQVAWIKQADPRPIAGFPEHSLTLQAELEEIARQLKTRFVMIKLAYYSSRTYAGYATTSLNPEPWAYESGFAVKWMIERQIRGDSDLNFDPMNGEVRAPWLAWGPYLWADGLAPRSDGLTWACEDFRSDGTHPASGAREKVSQMLLHFFKTDTTTRPWFVRAPR